MTVARVGPTSAISAKKMTNAAAVQTAASPIIDQTTLALTWSGSETMAGAAHTTVVNNNDAVVTPTAGRSASRRVKTRGPAA